MRKSIVSMCLLCLLSTIAVGCGHAQQTNPPVTQTTNSVQAQKPLYERTKPNSLPTVDSLKPTSVEIIRNEHGKLEALDLTISNEPTVRQLYSDLRSLRQFPHGNMSCPNDTGVEYKLIFKSGKKVVLVAQADPTGCQAIKLSNGQTLWGVEQVGKPFWTRLAQSIGYPNDSHFSGQSA
ncbi:hypothetical protein [Alicyclobacillus dauci]|uniref:Lipoprotein n=1 Tax=Alicyclobacillus dauci TaxID=1475485 RepID=A0ABY6Z823_9BACL|nr:hypothetical protein [Alicyclobacillus dauci]WAH39031.1 hypothetical protein NZD86_11380 [Alicyclobacillus dauci]